jgi:hypothetical protein
MDTGAGRCDTLRHMRLMLVVLLSLPLLGQTASEENYKAYTEAPRLLLRPSRLRLLTRERERQTIRHQQFDTYIQNGAAMPEAGFALALAGRIGSSEAHCGNAYAWVTKSKEADLRQKALVYDWCEPMLKDGQKAALAGALKAELPAIGNYASLRDRAFVALALVDVDGALSEKTLRETVEHWRKVVAPGLRQAVAVPGDQLYPLMEFLHVVRDNLEIDLRQDTAQYFLDLPLTQMLGYYPAPYPGPDNEFRIAFFSGDGDPDLKLATMLRAAELSLVSLDNNAELAQSLQGWLLQDRYLLRSALGIPYEFLWANPYQPGLTYHHLPNSYHDRRNGRLLIRSHWEEEAKFLCYYDGKIQLFEDGKRKELKVSPATPAVEMGGAKILVGGRDLLKPIQFELEGGEREAWYIVGLRPDTVYDLEIDDQELDELKTDRGGILSLEFAKATAKTGVRISLARFLKGSE